MCSALEYVFSFYPCSVVEKKISFSNIIDAPGGDDFFFPFFVHV